MFYAQFVLSKKGPLASIWLAAHWEKKLSKAQVFETNVDEAVDELMHPKVKMALRTTGHLMLGIVRIYSRRVKYLLEDCNAAYLKVNTSFSAGNARALEDRDDSNLPEIVNFDAQLPEFNDIDLPSAPAQINQSRIDDITLKEANSEGGDGSIYGDDLGGLDDFGEADFGSELEEGSDAVERGRRAASEYSSRPRIDVIPLEADKLDDFNNANELDEMFPDNDVPNGNMNEDVVLGSFQLEPLEQASIINERVTRPKRRKRLLVDEIKNIGGDEMKANMADFEDILQPLDLAPPTKKLLRIRETNTVDKLFSMPGCTAIVDPVLLRIYQSHLVVHSKTQIDTPAENVRRELGMSDLDFRQRSHTHLEDDEEHAFEAPSPPPFEPIDEVDENIQPEAFDLPSPTKETEKRTRRSRPDKERAEESGEEGDEDLRCSRKTHAVATAIATKLKTNDSITLNELLTKNATRKTAAQKFYALLELAKWEAIEVEQASPYGDIVITEGPQMAQVLA